MAIFAKNKQPITITGLHYGDGQTLITSRQISRDKMGFRLDKDYQNQEKIAQRVGVLLGIKSGDKLLKCEVKYGVSSLVITIPRNVEDIIMANRGSEHSLKGELTPAEIESGLVFQIESIKNRVAAHDMSQDPTHLSDTLNKLGKL